MPRIRTIKPEFWSDEKVMSVSRDARLLFIGMLNFADDLGVLKDSALELKARIFPGDEQTAVGAWRQELIDVGLVISYEVENKKYLQVCGLQKHQVIDKARKSNLPPPPSPEINRNQLKSTEILKGREGKGREVCVEGEKINQHTHTPIFSSENFQLSPEELAELCQVNADLSQAEVLAELPRASAYVTAHPKRHKHNGQGLMLSPLPFLRDWLARVERSNGIRAPAVATPQCQQPAAVIITPENVKRFAVPDCGECGGEGMKSQKVMNQEIMVRCECVKVPDG